MQFLVGVSGLVFMFFNCAHGVVVVCKWMLSVLWPSAGLEGTLCPSQSSVPLYEVVWPHGFRWQLRTMPSRRVYFSERLWVQGSLVQEPGFTPLPHQVVCDCHRCPLLNDCRNNTVDIGSNFSTLCHHMLLSAQITIVLLSDKNRIFLFPCPWTPGLSEPIASDSTVSILSLYRSAPL